MLESQGTSIITVPCSRGTPPYFPLNLNSGKQPFPSLSQSIEEVPDIVKASTNPCIGLRAAQPESNVSIHRAQSISLRGHKNRPGMQAA